jgi:hypothetical protein
MRHEGRELPNAFLIVFTPAEQRVIRVIFSVILSEGQCTKRLDEIAALGSTVRNSIKEAVYHGILQRLERRFGNAVSEPNVLTVPCQARL